MPRISTGNKTHVWRTHAAQETTSPAPSSGAAKRDSQATQGADASRARLG